MIGIGTMQELGELAPIIYGKRLGIAGRFFQIRLELRRIQSRIQITQVPFRQKSQISVLFCGRLCHIRHPHGFSTKTIRKGLLRKNRAHHVLSLYFQRKTNCSYYSANCCLCYERGASADQLFKKNILYSCFGDEKAAALKPRLHSCIKVANDSLQPDRVSSSAQEAKNVCRKLY